MKLKREVISVNDFSKRITLLCDTCGNDLFEYDSKYEYEEMPDDAIMTCSDCGRTYTKAELLECNHLRIQANVDDVKDEIIDELQRSIKKLFK